MRLYECFGTDATTGNIIKCFFYGFFSLKRESGKYCDLTE